MVACSRGVCCCTLAESAPDAAVKQLSADCRPRAPWRHSRLPPPGAELLPMAAAAQGQPPSQDTWHSVAGG